MINIRTDVKQSVVYMGTDKAQAWGAYENLNMYRKADIPVTEDIQITNINMAIEDLGEFTNYVVTVTINKTLKHDTPRRSIGKSLKGDN